VNGVIHIQSAIGFEEVIDLLQGRKVVFNTEK